MPEELYAQIGFGKYNDFKVDDEAVLTMRYPNNATGVFILSTGEGTYTEKLEITGSKGTILLEEDHLTVTTFDQDLREYRKAAQVNSREELHSEVVEEDLRPMNPASMKSWKTSPGRLNTENRCWWKAPAQ